MRQIIVSEWITLDGVFDADSMEVWFAPFHSDERAAYISNTITGSAALLLGGTTYRMLAPYWSSQTTDDMGPASKLNSMPKYVVSSTLEKAEWYNTQEIIKNNAEEQIRKLKREAGGNILISGSATLVQLLMAADLIDEYQFLVHPFIAGSGKRFFKEGMQTAELQLITTETLELGVTLLCYRPKPVLGKSLPSS